MSISRLVVCFVVATAQLIFGEPSAADLKLAAESEVYCASTATTKATPKMIIDKVKEAVVLLEKEGTKAFPKFKGKNSTFIFAGTYIWVNDFDGVMLMHPIKPAMEKQNFIGLKDSNGKRFFVDMIAVCKDSGEGWVDYLWPRPGEKERSLKVSYVHTAKCDGKDIVVGCGVYGMTMEEVGKAIGE